MAGVNAFQESPTYPSFLLSPSRFPSSTSLEVPGFTSVEGPSSDGTG